LLEIYAVFSRLLLHRPAPLWPINVTHFSELLVSHFWGALQIVTELVSNARLR
jgi:hypothetical protein